MRTFSSIGNASESFKVRSGVTQGCVLAPTHFAIYFAVLLHNAFVENDDGIYLRTRFDGSHFNLKRRKSKRLTTEVLSRELLLTDDTAIAMLLKSCLCWTGHVIRMEDHCIPKQLLFGELEQGHRKQGRPSKVSRTQ